MDLPRFEIQVDTLPKRIMTHIKKIENIEKQSVPEHVMPEVQDLKNDLIESEKIAQKMMEGIKESVELYIEEIRKLKEKVRESEEKIRSLEEKIRIFKENEDDHQQRVARLEGEIFGKDGEIARLNEIVKRHEIKLKEKESGLNTGQIAFVFEKDLATYIYSHDKKFGSSKIFTNMKKWLEEKKDTPQGREANEKWKALKDEFSWSSEHESVFFKLLESRKEIAHPTVDPDAVKLRISDVFTDEEKVRVNDIIAMIKRVNELMSVD